MQMRQQYEKADNRIPIQTFGESENNLLTPAQAQSLIPLTKESWYRAKTPTQIVNPYAQSPLMTRRRIGPYTAAARK